MNEKVNHPAHYNAGNVECIDAIESALGPAGFEAFCAGNALKYLWRYDHKNGTEDLLKCKFYLCKLIAERKDAETMNDEYLYSVLINGAVYKTGLTLYAATMIAEAEMESNENCNSIMIRKDNK